MNKQTRMAAALTASLAFYAGSAAAEFLDFTIQEGSVPGTPDHLVVGDKLNGGYTEKLTINADNTFDTSAYATIGQIFANEGTPPAEPAYLGNFGPQGYVMYAIFTSSGMFSGTTFTGTTGVFDLYIDPDSDTTFAFNGQGGDGVSTGNAGDDYKIASASNVTSLVGIVGDPGAYDFVWDDFTLTLAGKDYFIDPDPFYMTVNVDGDFDNFPIQPGTIDLTGDVSAVFIPEPTSLALIGMGLFGMGFRARRKV